MNKIPIKKIEKNLETKNYGIAEALFMGLQPVFIYYVYFVLKIS